MKKPQPVKNILFCFILFISVSGKLLAQPSNNTCATALSLVPASTCTGSSQRTGQTLLNATSDNIATTCGTAASPDVWYYFVATAANRPTITTSNLGTSWGANMRIQVFSRTGPCTGLVEVACGSSPLTMPTNLVNGNTYYIRVLKTTNTAATGANWGFDICIVDPPANDDCSGALTLTPAYTCTGGSQLTGQTLSNASSTGLASSCGTATSPDVWYKFVATSTRPNVTVSNLGSSWSASLRIQLFSSTSACTGLTEVGCANNAPLTPSSDLVLGNTYYIRIHKNSATAATGTNWGFDICVTNSPVNDHCANATTIPVSGGCNATAGNLYGAVQTNPAGSACGNRYDVWYKFTLPNNPEATYAAIGVSFTSGTSALTLSNTSVELFNTSTCPVDNTSLGCSALNNNNNPKSFTGLTPGGTYIFRVMTTANTNNNPANWGFNVCVTTFQPYQLGSSGRMREVFQQTVLSPPGVLADPWEITYGPDNNLWITESKGYKVYKMNPATGVKTTVLDISQGSTFLAAPDQIFNCQFANGSGAQGGLAGLALHPKFLDATAPENYVYISYIYSQTSSTVFTNRVVRFTYNTATGKLESPVSLCDTLPGSSDHNSQRMIIKPVAGTNYLFYAAGDMGAGQFGNNMRTNKAQMVNAYEGKILRFNLVPDGDAGTLDKWIPNNNPYNATLGVQSAVWAIGIRNNQGFVYDPVLDKLYGSSHGPFSDDEINVIEPAKNYGHPLVIGYSWDDNVNGTTAGAAPGMSPAHPSSCPMITDESDNAAAIGASYKDPLFSAYPSSTLFPSINALWNTLPSTPNNGLWPSEGWSGLDMYSQTLIPGWKRSLIAASLKWGRLVKIRLDASGEGVIPTGGADTVSYFGSTNRFRDLAFAPNGKDIFVIMDRSSTTSGPSALNPIVPACPGCVQKYTFLGYADNAGKSSIPDAIDVTSGVTNFISNAGTSVTIDASNSNLWVPITGPDGNIMAEIYANGQNLGTITSSFYQNSGPIRVKGPIHYLDRSITINPSVAPTGPVKVRFYISKAEYDALDADPTSSLSNPNQLRIFKNSDPNGSAMTAATKNFYPHTIELRGTNSDAYVLQSDTISSFSTFYFAAAPATLPVDLISFTGSLQKDNSVLLKWETTNEVNTSHFVVERSIDGSSFSPIGTVSANGNGTAIFRYAYTDADAANQSSAKLYYRLKMVDLDAKYTYSDIVTIALPYISGHVAAYPNPFATELKVTMGAEQDGRVQWKLFDNNGRTVMQHTERVKKGNNVIAINGNKLSAGFYYLSIQGAGIDKKIKLQKL